MASRVSATSCTLIIAAPALAASTAAEIEPGTLPVNWPNMALREISTNTGYPLAPSRLQ